VEKEKKMASAGYFGLCPICKKTDSYVNIGRSQWFFCEEHRVRWCIGSDVFSSWRYETESAQQSHCERIGFDEFTDVEPFYPKIKGVRRLKDEGDKPKKPVVRSKKSTESRDLVRRKRRLSSSKH
jgi:hypothetical protein